MSVRRWAYAAFGDSATIQFIALVTPEDLAAQAEYIRLADCQGLFDVCFRIDSNHSQLMCRAGPTPTTTPT
jgi:hypothetical protein